MSKYAALARSVGTTHFPKYRPSTTGHQDATKECRLQSCLHSITGRRQEFALSDSWAQSLDILSTVSLLYPIDYNPPSRFPASNQRLNASRKSRKRKPRIFGGEGTAPPSPNGAREFLSELQLQRLPWISPSRTVRSNANNDFPKPSPATARFMEYALDCSLARQHPQQAHDACAAWLSGRTTEELEEVSQEHRLAYIEGMLRAIVIRWAQVSDVVPDEWIIQLEELLAVSGPPVPDPYHGKRRILSVAARILALKGDIGQADTLLRNQKSCSLPTWQCIDIMNAVIVSLCRTRPPEEVLKYLEDGIDELPPLYLCSYRSAPAMKVLSDLFHDGSFDHLVPERTPSFHPAVFMLKTFLLRRGEVSKPVLQLWVKQTIEAFMMKPAEVKAQEIRGLYGIKSAYRSFVDSNVTPRLDMRDQALQIRSLEELLALYPGRDAFWYSTNLFVAALKGDVTVAEDCFNRYARLVPPKPREVTSLLNAYANAGNIPGLTKAFDRHIPSTATLQTQDLRPVFYALSRSPVPQHEAMQYWRGKLRQANLVPNSSIYALMAQYYAKHNDGWAIKHLFREIQQSGIRVNRFFYHIAMRFFAMREDFEATQSLFDHATLNGTILKTDFLIKLMNMYAEAGSWSSFDAANEQLKSVDVPTEIDSVRNAILFKAAHLRGVPYDLLLGQLSSLKGSGMKPTLRLYCTVVKAARDAGDMEAAERMYLEMVARDAEDPGFLRSDHIFSILISGYAHHGDIQKALSLCREMCDRGFRPSMRVISTLRAAVAKLPEVEARVLEPILTEMVNDSPGYKGQRQTKLD